MFPITSLQYWIFDMDGTLTVPLHNFEKIRLQLGVPAGMDIISFMEKQTETEARETKKKLEDIELWYAERAEIQPDLIPFLEQLLTRGCRLGVITRNNRKHTDITMEKTGLMRYFDTILTREFEPAKPHPASVEYFLTKWNAPQDTTVMIGDYVHDIEAGRAAGVHTIYFDSRKDCAWNSLAERTAHSWGELLEELP
ncbi:HAD family hydrolase [Chitinivibrio alkaliphilus]|uniref:HAD-superfamily hydrolase n=1 Tax=Chitinivibrio alkaliphilus ACht1 TaxID=1313304 RepID=U7DAE4_9BACT|nr:HAD family hydrolase [Chitinivibrio alkaliphilus]ERP39369.1 HAD-superfamily hydrolase [Chitinivibrio alkaliphilus ACht1]